MDSRKRAIIAFIILVSKSKHAVGIYEKTQSDYYKFVRISPTDAATIRILDADSVSRIHGNMPLFFDGLTNSYLKITRRGYGRYICYDSYSNTYATALCNLDSIVIYDMQHRGFYLYSPKRERDEQYSMTDEITTKCHE